MIQIPDEAINRLMHQCDVDMPTRGDQLKCIHNLVRQACAYAVRSDVFHNVIAVERTSDQGVKLVFTSCHQASVFEQLAKVSK